MEDLIKAQGNGASEEQLIAIYRSGLSVNSRSRDGATPLHVACWIGGYPSLVRLLVNDGADVNSVRDRGWTPLLDASSDTGKTEIVKFLIEHGARLSDRRDDGQTALHLAVAMNNRPTTELLIKSGLDVNIKDNEERTPLYYAKDKDIASLLSRSGAHHAIDKGGPKVSVQGYELLFPNASADLTPAEKREIYQHLGFRLAKSRQFLVDDTCEKDVAPVVRFADLNGDGVNEVFVFWGNLCTSGMTGRSITLFIKNQKGHFVSNLGFPAETYEKLRTSNGGFPDLTFIGRGFCHGVWRWSGTKYRYRCSLPTVPRGCDAHEVELCEREAAEPVASPIPSPKGNRGEPLTPKNL